MTGAFTARFDVPSTSADAIQRAAYVLTDRCSMELTRAGDVFECSLFPKDDTDGSDLLHEFRNEVLDQVLRERIRSQTEGVRNLILSIAFSQTTAPTGPEDAPAG